MSKDELYKLVLDYLDGNLDPLKLDILKHELEMMGYGLDNLEELKSLVKTMDEIEIPGPSSVMSDRFYQMLEAEMDESKLASTEGSILSDLNNFLTQFLTSKLSYGLIMLLFGWMIGFWIMPNTSVSNQMSQMNTEIQQMKELVMFSMLDQPMASERLQAMKMISTSPVDNEKIIGSLLEALNKDSDVNVRMAAVEALLAFANLDQVRTGLKESVFKQNSPLVQLTLVDGLVAINDKAAIPIFERLISSNDVHQAVKDRSREGITKLI
ncbi:MAG: hypothetical protein CVU00_09160 [Bacteroidetes bacterium HGW-Bacteroidetes-17]|nr:MAG: hypothetical protein CVU00_09160 [Bacteroidetes bacterium HGW-Bacteroidetes-17]